MKKILLILTLVLLLFALIACGGEETTNPDTTTEPVTTADPVTTTEPSVESPEDETVVSEYYTAVLNNEKWSADSVDMSQYVLFGTGQTVYNSANSKYSSYKRSWVIEENGSEKALSFSELKKMAMVGATVTIDEAEKKAKFTVSPVEAKVQASWKEVTAKAGSYLMFEFTTNLPMDFAVTVTPKEGGSATTAAYVQENITATGKNGEYVGIAKCTVPYSEGKTFYINICAGSKSGGVMASVPVHITKMKYDSPYKLMFQGDWELIRDETYLPRLIELFYNVYPRVYERWGTGTEPKTITFMADKNYDGVAYNAGTLVCVSTTYANSNPEDIGFFAHEITHATQQFDKMKYEGGWFTEHMADLGRFRYFHWGYDTRYVKIYSMNDKSIRDWDWHPYGAHNIFMSYLDWKYPTVDKNKDGKLTMDEYGLVDYIVFNEKKWTGGMIDDNPYTVGSTFNNWVKDVTGLETIEAVRLQFVKDLDDGVYNFIGFGDFVDNYRTENIPGVPNPTYPMKKAVEPSAPTNPKLAVALKDGTNICLGAKIHSVTTAGSMKYAASNLIDGDETTRYQAGKSDSLYGLNGIQNEIVIDLGDEKTFDTYTLVSAGDASKTPKNGAKAWEILVSKDGVTYTALDYQKDNTEISVSVTFAVQTARYIKIRLYKADQGVAGTARLYEFMLFDTQK